MNSGVFDGACDGAHAAGSPREDVAGSNAPAPGAAPAGIVPARSGRAIAHVDLDSFYAQGQRFGGLNSPRLRWRMHGVAQHAQRARHVKGSQPSLVRGACALRSQHPHLGLLRIRRIQTPVEMKLNPDIMGKPVVVVQVRKP